MVRIRKLPTIAMLALMSIACLTIWLPLNPHASRRASWSPWPAWSARVLNASGIEVRDYEVDGHRLDPHERMTDRLNHSAHFFCQAGYFFSSSSAAKGPIQL